MKNSIKLYKLASLLILCAILICIFCVIAIAPKAAGLVGAMGLVPLLLGMAWPTTGATGGDNVAAGSYSAYGSGTTILWGTNNFIPTTDISGFLTVTKASQKTLIAADENLPNGDGATAGKVIIVDGMETDIEVRDDINQPVANLQVGKWILIQDGAGMLGTRYAKYKAIIIDHGWDSAPKTPAGRTLKCQAFLLLQNI
jgi:hypothetical protein